MRICTPILTQISTCRRPLSLNYASFRLCSFPLMPLSFLPLSVYAPFRFGKYSIMPNSFLPLPFLPLSFLPFSVNASFRFGKYAILPNSFLPLSVYAPFRFGKYLITPFSFMPFSFMLLSVYAPFRLCPFPYMPLSGLMEIVDYAGFLYANFRRPVAPCQARPVGFGCGQGKHRKAKINRLYLPPATLAWGTCWDCGEGMESLRRSRIQQRFQQRSKSELLARFSFKFLAIATKCLATTKQP
jgi:hypothetical protein